MCWLDRIRNVLARPRTLLSAAGLEFDPHDDAPGRGSADLGKPGGGEDAAAADIELAPGDLLPSLRDHRIALEDAGAARPRVIDGGARQRVGDAAPPEARARDEAGHGPHAVVARVFVAPAPGHGAVEQTRIGRARLNRAPAHGLAVELSEKSARPAALAPAAADLLTQTRDAF